MAAMTRLAQMAQLRRDGSFRKLRGLCDFGERQPNVARKRALHQLANRRKLRLVFFGRTLARLRLDDMPFRDLRGCFFDLAFLHFWFGTLRFLRLLCVSRRSRRFCFTCFGFARLDQRPRALRPFPFQFVRFHRPSHNSLKLTRNSWRVRLPNLCAPIASVF